MSVQFSGGEPRCRHVSWMRCGTRRRSGTTAFRRPPMASSSPRVPSLRKRQPKPDCGMRICSLTASATRPIRIAVRQPVRRQLQAIENLWSAGVDIVPVVTIVNGVNNEQVGASSSLRSTIPGRSTSCRSSRLLHRPRRRSGPTNGGTLSAIRCRTSRTTSKNQVGLGEPIRDWFRFPLWAPSPTGPTRSMGRTHSGQSHLRLPSELRCRHGADDRQRETKEAVPVTAFLKAEQLAKDVAAVNDAGRGKFLSSSAWRWRSCAITTLPGADPFQADRPAQKFDKTFGAPGATMAGSPVTATKADIDKRRGDRWNFLFVAACGSGSVQLRLPAH